jgi:hypothetical protein
MCIRGIFGKAHCCAWRDLFNHRIMMFRISIVFLFPSYLFLNPNRDGITKQKSKDFYLPYWDSGSPWWNSCYRYTRCPSKLYLSEARGVQDPEDACAYRVLEKDFSSFRWPTDTELSSVRASARTHALPLQPLGRHAAEKQPRKMIPHESKL